MGPVQGISGVGAASTYSAPKAQAIAASKPEGQESVSQERTEAQRGAQEAGEQATAKAPVGTHINLTA